MDLSLPERWAQDADLGQSVGESLRPKRQRLRIEWPEI
jgi:hypothetical protein